MVLATYVTISSSAEYCMRIAKIVVSTGLLNLMEVYTDLSMCQRSGSQLNLSIMKIIDEHLSIHMVE